MTIADEFVERVAQVAGGSFDAIWHEIRDVWPETRGKRAALYDVWFGAEDGPSIVAMLNEQVDSVRVLCDEFEFENLKMAEASEVVGAVLADQASIEASGAMVRTLVLRVRGRHREWIARASARVDQPSDWELRLMTKSNESPP